MTVKKYNPIRDTFNTSGFTSNSTALNTFIDVKADYSPTSKNSFNPYCATQSKAQQDSSEVQTECGAKYCSNYYRGNCNNGVFKANHFHCVDLSKISTTNLNRFSVCIDPDALMQHLSLPYRQTASLKQIRYNGDSGELIESGYISLNQLGTGQIRVAETLDAYDAFTIELSYRSTGSHVGAIESLFGASLHQDHNHGLCIYITNKNGGLGIDLDSDTNLTFDQLNLNDGQEHILVLTWDSIDGQINVYDNHVHVASGHLMKGAMIREGTLALLGGEQEHTALRIPENGATNIQIHGCTMAYECIEQRFILEGIPLAQSATDLAFDLQVRHGRVVDLANHSFVAVTGDVSVISNYEFYPTHGFTGDIDLSLELEEGLKHSHIHMLLHDK